MNPINFGLASTCALEDVYVGFSKFLLNLCTHSGNFAIAFTFDVEPMVSSTC